MRGLPLPCVWSSPSLLASAASAASAVVRRQWLLLAVVWASQFTENTGKLHIEELRVPNPLILGSSTDLMCQYQWDQATRGTRRRQVYSVKWYRGNEEFYRYVPSEDPKIVTFPRNGIFVDDFHSNATLVHLRTIQWTTSGLYRCEVTTADDFDTVTASAETEVVAVPLSGPDITGQKVSQRYMLGDTVDLNCTSNSSDPLPDLSWYINSELALKHQLINYPWIREPTNLMTRTLGLRFRLTSRHLQFVGASSVKVKCTAMLLTVYLKSNEVSLEVVRGRSRSRSRSQETSVSASSHVSSSSSSSSGNALPALESRDGKSQVTVYMDEFDSGGSVSGKASLGGAGGGLEDYGGGGGDGGDDREATYLTRDRSSSNMFGVQSGAGTRYNGTRIAALVLGLVLAVLSRSRSSR